MNDSCNTTHGTERPMEPAKLSNCKECPFRKENRNREHPLGIQYTDGEFAKLWRGVSQDGGMFGCHMWDADLHPFDETVKEAGYHKPAEVGSRIECAGMVAMVERELDEADAAPSYSAYKEARPLGMSKKAIMVYSARRRGEVGPELRFSEHINKDDILDPHDVIDTGSVKWQMSESEADKLLRSIQAVLPEARECDCEVCKRHTEVHPALTLVTAENLTVDVDAELHPLLTAMAGAGIRTTDSCINMHETITAIAPESYGSIINGHDRNTMNYETSLRLQAAFIRLRNENDAEQAFIAKASEVPEVEVMTSGGLTQVVFPQNTVQALLKAVTE
ncbi:hypothetical protein [Arthrobacter sp. 135MFCol5.1]|uniref:hypothetical protein n=1 Tax=Arthrobacter sp. 135MFCol5.1 TaxID=1158050 RepID=UPI000366E778|nr:hypothetical protein [Arthrobacter sp. 135MFCol5.1]